MLKQFQSIHHSVITGSVSEADFLIVVLIQASENAFIF